MRNDKGSLLRLSAAKSPEAPVINTKSIMLGLVS